MGFQFKELLVILVIVLLLFGTKRLSNIGSDIGDAIRNFRKAVRENEGESDATPPVKKAEEKPEGRVIEGEVSSKPTDKVGN